MSRLDELLSHDGLLHKFPKEKLDQLQRDIARVFKKVDDAFDPASIKFMAMVLPAIHFNQFRLYRDKTGPVAWVSWAFMTTEEAGAYMEGNFDFKISTWIGGEHLWVIDFLTPFGHASKVANELKQTVFADHVVFSPDVTRRSGKRRVRQFYGANVVGQDRLMTKADFVKSADVK